MTEPHDDPEHIPPEHEFHMIMVRQQVVEMFADPSWHPDIDWGYLCNLLAGACCQDGEGMQEKAEQNAPSCHPLTGVERMALFNVAAVSWNLLYPDLRDFVAALAHFGLANLAPVMSAVTFDGLPPFVQDAVGRSMGENMPDELAWVFANITHGALHCMGFTHEQVRTLHTVA